MTGDTGRPSTSGSDAEAPRDAPKGRPPAPGGEAGGRTSPMRAHSVLLVDTHVGFRDRLARALERFELEVVWRARVLGLADAIAEHDPVAIILSADLPGGDPVELLRQIRDRSDQGLRAVFIVGDEVSRKLELAAYARGADAVLARDGATPELAARLMGRAGLRARQRRGTARSVADAALALCGSTTAARDDRRDDARRNGTPAAAREPAAADPRPAAGGFPGLGPQYRGSPPPDTRRAAGPGGAGSSNAVPDVVLVEDDPALLEMLRYALTNRGYSTLSFSNGLDALRALSELDTAGRRPVVLLDVDLPGLDGFRILHELGSARPGSYQVILCTVHSSEATHVLGIQSGALDYLTKPLRIPIVLAKVERLLGRGSLSAAAGG